MSTIQTNNADLQAILNAVQALPDKMAAPTYETRTVTLSGSGSPRKTIYNVVTTNGIEKRETNETNTDIQNVLVNSLIYVYVESSGYEFHSTAGFEVIYYDKTNYLYAILRLAPQGDSYYHDPAIINVGDD